MDTAPLLRRALAELEMQMRVSRVVLAHRPQEPPSAHGGVDPEPGRDAAEVEIYDVEIAAGRLRTPQDHMA
jgi:hypothetical protein